MQSQRVYGCAGNSAAVPPWHRLGLRVAEIPTTLLSNAPFYLTTRGRVLPAEWFSELLCGARERGLHRRAKALVSGYLGSAANGNVLADWVEQIQPEAPQLQFFLDPVIGDTHTGPYVEPALEAVFREWLVRHAWMVTPNAWELGRLTSMPVDTEAAAVAAARHLLAQGPHWVVTHSVPGAHGMLLALAVAADACWKIATPELAIDVAGTGDVLTALLTACLLRGNAMPRATEKAVAAVHAMLKATLAQGWEEIDLLVAVPAAMAAGPARFPAIAM